jgi:hypothetical protein
LSIVVNAAFLAVAAIAFGAAVIKAASMLRPRRQPGQGLLLILLFTLAVACLALSDTVQQQEDRLYHDLGRLLGNVSTMVTAFAILALLITLSMPLPEARPRIRRRLAALAGCTGGMITAFAVASPLPETPRGLRGPVRQPPRAGGLYRGVPGVLRHRAGRAPGTGLAVRAAGPGARALRAGLLLMGAGSVFGLAYVAEKAVYVFTQVAHLPPPFAAAPGCRTLLTPPQCAFSVTFPVAAVLLTATGATLPVWGPALAWPFGRYRTWRTVRALGPLREDIYQAFPGIALPEPGDGPRWDLALRLYRRVIEIDDGRLLLRPYLSEAATAAATVTAAKLGLRGDELRAAVEAAEITAALRAFRSGSAAPAPLPEHAAPDRVDVLREAAWLAKVARASASSPISRDLDIWRQEQEAASPSRQNPLTDTVLSRMMEVLQHV